MGKNKTTPSVSTQQVEIKIDLRYPGFLAELADLTDEQRDQFAECTTKLQQTTWQQLWEQSSKGPQKTGFNYEDIGRETAAGDRIHSIRVTKKFRALVIRKKEWMVFISLHPDHDSAYI